MVTTTVTPQGGYEIGGSASVGFVHGSPPIASDIVVEWDFDNDGDFDDPLEDVTEFVVEAESLTGRDFPSQLTGKSGPGQLKLTLRNDDGRFSYFNAASPLRQDPLSLESGRKIRIRTVEATGNPDPTLLAKDRFMGSGALGSDELGNAWTAATGTGTFTRQGDSSGDTLAVPESKGSLHIATVDVGTSNAYAQVKYKFIDGDDSNEVGLVYRFQDVNNRGAVRIIGDAGTGLAWVDLIRTTGGTSTIIEELQIERRTDVTLGVLVTGGAATVYLDGVAVYSDVAVTGSSTKFGIYSNWEVQRPPSLHEFYVWDRLPAEVEGVLWTGYVAEVEPMAALGPNNTVSVSAEGVLSLIAGQEIDPPRSVGEVPDSPGVTTGILVGHVLSSVKQLHPPGPLDEGDVRTGAVGLPPSDALDLLRKFEEVEWGFLYETQEGYVAFEARSARLNRDADAWFSDQPGAQFGYTSLGLGNWRREVINRVRARLSPRTPVLMTATSLQGSTGVGVANDVSVTLEDAAAGAVEGDLVLLVIISTIGTSGVEWLTPIGWKSYRDAKDFLGRLRVYGKVMDESDFGVTYTFYDDTGSSGGTFLVRRLRIRDWYGSLDDGVLVAEPVGFGQPNSVTKARQGLNDPPPVFPSWGPAPSMFIPVRSGATSVSGMTVAAANDANSPNGHVAQFASSVNGTVNGFDAALQLVIREDCVTVEDPSPFGSAPDVFEGFEYVETTTIAVRGYAGDPPETQGGQLIQVDDFDSQTVHNAIRIHDNSAELFADEEDATAYAEAVLIQHANDRPILALSFVATSSAAYRGQALRRRVGHKIRLTANGDTGMGVDGDFFIEAISHRWTDSFTHWVVTWQLSPA